MKKLVVLSITAAITFFVACQKKTLQPSVDNEPDKSVITTYRDNLQNNVDSIRLVSSENSLFQKAINSEQFKISKIEYSDIGEEIAIYYYSNGYKAVLFSDKSQSNVFTYIVDDKGVLFDALSAVFEQEQKKKNSRNN